MEECSVNIGGIPLHYKKTGQGPALLLLHGWGCEGGFMRAAAQSVAHLRTCYLPDFPGFGQTPEPPDGWAIEDYARLILGFMDALGLKKADVLGHSFGGRVVLLLASGSPGRVGRAVITGGAGLKPRRKPIYHIKVWFYKLGKRLAAMPRANSFLKKLGLDLHALAQNAGSPDYRALSPGMKKVFVRVVNRDLRPCLAQIKAPTLLIWGDGDSETPIEYARIMNREIKDSALIAFEGCGHYAFLEQSGRFGAIIQSFFGGEQQ